MLSVKLYQTIHELNKPRVMEKWHASSIAECPRTQYFRRKGVPALSEPSAALMLRWKAGHAIETAIRPYLEHVFPDIVSNERLENNILTGEYDNYVPKDKAIIEVKSVHDYAFKEHGGEVYLKEQDGTHPNGNKKWIPKLTPYLHHELQNHCYVKLLREAGKEVEKIIYVYISLSGRIATYETAVQPKLVEAVERRLKELNKAWESQTPPDCVCSPDNALFDSVLQYCPYKTEQGCCDLELLKKLEATNV